MMSPSDLMRTRWELRVNGEKHGEYSQPVASVLAVIYSRQGYSTAMIPLTIVSRDGKLVEVCRG